MLRVSRHNLLFNRGSYHSLKFIYGIGMQVANNFCRYLGFRGEYILSNIGITGTQHSISFFLSDFFLKIEFFLEIYLKRKKRIDLHILKKIRIYRGVRHLHGLPARGQRRHSNARTVRKMASSKKFN